MSAAETKSGTKPAVGLISSTLRGVPGMAEALEEAFDLIPLDEVEGSVAKDIRGLVSSARFGANAALMDRFPKLEIIGNFGVGYDTTDIEAAKARKIVVTNTPGVLANDVADLALGLLLSLCRDLPGAHNFTREGRWTSTRGYPLQRALTGLKVGVVGLGDIGRGIARRAKAFEMEVAYSGPREKTDQPYPYHPEVASLAKWADVLVLACPGGPVTRHLVNEAVLEALGADGMVINISRGSVIDEEALVRALESGRLWGAGLDVFEKEPEIPEALRRHPRVILSPHQGSATQEVRRAMGQLVVKNLIAHFAGEPHPTRVI